MGSGRTLLLMNAAMNYKKKRLVYIQDMVRLRHFLGGALRLGQARGELRSQDRLGAERRGQDRLEGRVLRLELALSLSYNSLQHSGVTEFGCCLKIFLYFQMNVRGGQKILLAFCVVAAIFSVIKLYHFNQGNNQFLNIFVI